VVVARVGATASEGFLLAHYLSMSAAVAAAAAEAAAEMMRGEREEGW